MHVPVLAVAPLDVLGLKADFCKRTLWHGALQPSCLHKAANLLDKPAKQHKPAKQQRPGCLALPQACSVLVLVPLPLSTTATCSPI